MEVRSGSSGNFATELRAATWSAHVRVASHPFARRLLRGRLPLADYTALVAEHHQIYTVLERLGDEWRDDPVAGPFIADGLRRVPALEVDLGHLCGDRWRGAERSGPALERYLARLEATSAAGPEGFLAHHYARYVGDITGGRYIGRAVRAAYGFDDRGGATFYDFAAVGIDDVLGWYRDRLNGAPLTAAGRTAVADEAVVALELHLAMFDELDAADHAAPAG